MCLTQPRPLWLTPFRYEVRDEEAMFYIEKLSTLEEVSIFSRFGTCEEIRNMLILEQKTQ